MKRLAIIIMFWLLVASPVYAADPTLLEQIQAYLSPVVDFLDDYAELAGCAGTSCTLGTEVNTMLGPQIFSTEDTGQGPTSVSPPGDYYPDSPQMFREIGYVFETLATVDAADMSLLDYVDWLAVGFALPFAYARSMYEFLQADVGPLALFLTWLFAAAFWVFTIYAISFIIQFIKTLLGLGEKVLAVIALFRP